MFRSLRGDRDRGAALVEFAVVTPLFFLLVFGIIEAGWAFAQMNDVHHGVREGTRLAAVNYDDPDNDPALNDVMDQVCGRMGLVAGSSPVITLQATDTNGDGFVGRGDTGTSSVTVDYQSLTGALDFVFGALTLSSDADFRLEQPLEGPGATWMGTRTCP